MRSAISKSKQGLGDLTKTDKALTSTMRISSRQVRHNADSEEGGRSYDVEGEGEEVLAEMIYQQDQRAFLQEDIANRVEESAERQFLQKKRFQIHLREDVRNAPRAEVTAAKR